MPRKHYWEKAYSRDSPDDAQVEVRHGLPIALTGPKKYVIDKSLDGLRPT
jgi:hypothetical protein